MLLSMTGFGKECAEADNKKITVEIKSLNSKQMDLTTRVPSSLRSIELELRGIVGRELQRGKADLIVTIECTTCDDCVGRINVDALRAYKKQIEQAAGELGIEPPADMFMLMMRFPDSFKAAEDEKDNPEIYEAVKMCALRAAQALNEHRRAEGIRLERFFEERIESIKNLLDQIAPYEAERVPRIRARLEEGLAKIPVAEYDKGRLEQELIFYIEKLDVNEERQRLAQHLRYFLETMADVNPGQGKKLGFIAQEMGREINTLGSKSNHAEMQRIVVMMKDVLEQIKEQVLNVL